MAIAETSIASDEAVEKTETDEQQSWFESLLTSLGSSDTVDVSDGIDWGVLPGPFSNPEQGFGIGVAAIGLYAPQGLDRGNQLSTLTISAYGSSKGSFGVGVSNSTFLNNNIIKLGFEGAVSYSPEQYWGIGKEAAENESNQTKHTALYLNLEPTVSYQFIPHYFIKAGITGTFLYNQEAEGTALSSEELENKTDLGMLLALEYDTRDYERNPYNGRYISLEQRQYFDLFGGDYDYKKLIVNYREYVNVVDDNVLAFDLYYEGLSDEDELPWFAMSKLGGDKRMRGYYTGQYRDRYQLATQLEYRHRFNTRNGIAVWIGAGNIAEHFNLLFEDKWLPTYGIGYRFAFKPRVNVRLDLAFGSDTTVYFNVYEAF
jgi:outer membrane protein assembly factor BamA